MVEDPLARLEMPPEIGIADLVQGKENEDTRREEDQEALGSQPA